MNIRDELLTALVRETLGPRNGPKEILPAENDPRQEYITGVLEPRNARTQDDRIEDQVDSVIEETSSDEDQDNQGYVAATGMFSPALDPRALPRSIGLSFTLEAEQGEPSIEICATWARYLQNADEDYERQPCSYLTGKVNAAAAARGCAQSAPLAKPPVDACHHLDEIALAVSYLLLLDGVVGADFVAAPAGHAGRFVNPRDGRLPLQFVAREQGQDLGGRAACLGDGERNVLRPLAAAGQVYARRDRLDGPQFWMGLAEEFVPIVGDAQHLR